MVKKYQKYIWWGVLSGLTLLGGTLRAWGLSSISLDVDEAITLSAAQGLLAVGKSIIQASGLYYGRDILGTFTTAASVGLFGSSEWAARLPMLILGTATIPFTYLLARQLKLTHPWALMAAAGVTFSQWGIYYAHSARMYQEQQFFVLLTTLAAVWTLQRWSWWKVLITSFLSILAVLAHRSAIIILPILILLGVWTKRQDFRVWLSSTSHRLCLWSGVATALLILLLGQLQWDLVSDVWRYIVGTDRNPFTQLQLHLVPFRHVLRMHPIWLLGMVLAWIWVKRKSGLHIVLGIVWSVLISVDLLIYPNEPNYRTRYFYAVIPLVFVLGAFSFDQLWSWFSAKYSNKWLMGFTWVVLVVALLVPGSTLRPLTVYADQPEWNRVRDLPADVVIAHPTAPAQYYLGHVDYWLVSHKGEIRTYSENNQDIYAGAAILLDPQELTSILTTQHGVVVLETNRLKFISKDLRQTLKANAQKDQALSTDLLQVWKF